MTEIHLLGTRGNVPYANARHARHSGVLIANDLLLDAGEASFLRHRPRWTLITHLHPDHAFFVAHPPDELPAVYAPEEHPNCRATLIRPGQPLRLGRWRILPLGTIHSHTVRSVAYRVDAGGMSVFYTGDLVAIEPRYHRFLRGLDLVITDGSFLRRGGLVRRDRASGRPFGHAGIPDLIDFFSRWTNHIVIVHLGSWFYRDPPAAHRRVRSLGREHDVKAQIGWDGMNVQLV